MAELNVPTKERGTLAGVSREAPVSGSSRPAATMVCTIGVSTGCGHTAHMRTPRRASLGAAERTKCTSAALLAAYTGAIGICVHSAPQLPHWRHIQALFWARTDPVYLVLLSRAKLQDLHCTRAALSQDLVTSLVTRPSSREDSSYQTDNLNNASCTAAHRKEASRRRHKKDGTCSDSVCEICLHCVPLF